LLLLEVLLRDQESEIPEGMVMVLAIPADSEKPQETLAVWARTEI
jgi:hypothetical protein